MTAQIIDYNLAALERMSERALQTGNPFESYAMRQLIEGYKEGIWKVRWEGGEPIFEAALTSEEIRAQYGKYLDPHASE